MTFQEFILEEEKKDYYKGLMDFVKGEYATKTCFPPYSNIFYAFMACPLEKVKVVILGQDPYHEINQAHGLAFSSLDPKTPASLRNIYKEIESDLGIKLNQDNNLSYLAKQGVLLLNTVLTVEEGKANSHAKHGWETLTDNIIKELNKKDEPIVFILWGNPSQKKEKYLNNPKHLIIKSAHPSPLSAYNGFFGSKPFSKTNEFLRKNNIDEIKWYQ